eukprot:gene9259-6510_t
MSSEDELQRAAALYRERRFHDALTAYAAIADSSTVSPEDRVRALNNTSACYAAMKNYDKAVEQAKEALQLDPENPQSFYRLAAAYEGQLHYEESVALLRRALEVKPHHPPYAAALQRVERLLKEGRGIASDATKKRFYYDKHLTSGIAAMKAGSYTEAVRHFTQALELAPDTTPARDRAVLYANRSAANFKLEAMEASTADAERSRTEDPAYPRAHFRLAVSLEAQQQLPEALEAAQACLALDSAHAEALEMVNRLQLVVANNKKTVREREKDDCERLAQLQADRLAQRSTIPAVFGVQKAHTTSFAYCSYCNDHGHVRSECPMLRAKRRRRRGAYESGSIPYSNEDISCVVRHCDPPICLLLPLLSSRIISSRYLFLSISLSPFIAAGCRRDNAHFFEVAPRLVQLLQKDRRIVLEQRTRAVRRSITSSFSDFSLRPHSHQGGPSGDDGPSLLESVAKEFYASIRDLAKQPQVELEVRLTYPRLFVDSRSKVGVRRRREEPPAAPARTAVTPAVHEADFERITKFLKEERCGVTGEAPAVETSLTEDVNSRDGRASFRIEPSGSAVYLKSIQKNKLAVRDIALPDTLPYNIRVCLSKELEESNDKKDATDVTPKLEQLRGYRRRKSRTSIRSGPYVYDLTAVVASRDVKTFEVEIEYCGKDNITEETVVDMLRRAEELVTLDGLVGMKNPPSEEIPKRAAPQH